MDISRLKEIVTLFKNKKVAVAGDLNNRDINDDNCAQELSADEIRRLKEDGLAGQVCPFALPLMLGC